MCRIPFEGRWPKALKHFLSLGLKSVFIFGLPSSLSSSYFHCCRNLTSQEVLGYLQLLTETAILCDDINLLLSKIRLCLTAFSRVIF